MCLDGCPRPWHHVEHPALLDVIGVILKLTASEMALDTKNWDVLELFLLGREF